MSNGPAGSPYQKLISEIAQIDGNIAQARHAAGGDIPEIRQALDQMSALAMSLSQTLRSLDINAQRGMLDAQAPQAEMAAAPPVNPGYSRPPVDEAAFAASYPDL